jgi:hypothetical protein
MTQIGGRPFTGLAATGLNTPPRRFFSRWIKWLSQIFISFSFAHAGVLETEFHAELQNARIVRVHRMHERNAAQATLVAAVSGKVH